MPQAMAAALDPAGGYVRGSWRGAQTCQVGRFACSDLSHNPLTMSSAFALPPDDRAFALDFLRDHFSLGELQALAQGVLKECARGTPTPEKGILDLRCKFLHEFDRRRIGFPTLCSIYAHASTP
jgi:hypothetical protein